MQSVCVFCGSNSGRLQEYVSAAREMGRELARRGMTLVYGGGRVGLMGQVADAALAEGGRVIGVIPAALEARELAHTGVTELRVVGTMHERKAMMADLADGFVALPGGFGTFEELCEAITWLQLGIHAKPCAVLNVAGYYDPLLAMFDHGVREGFVRPEHRGSVLSDPRCGALLDRMAAFQPSHLDKWMDRTQD